MRAVSFVVRLMGYAVVAMFFLFCILVMTELLGNYKQVAAIVIGALP